MSTLSYNTKQQTGAKQATGASWWTQPTTRPATKPANDQPLDG